MVTSAADLGDLQINKVISLAMSQPKNLSTPVYLLHANNPVSNLRGSCCSHSMYGMLVKFSLSVHENVYFTIFYFDCLLNLSVNMHYLVWFGLEVTQISCRGHHCIVPKELFI